MTNLKYLNELIEHYEFSSAYELLYELLPRGYNVTTSFSEIPDIALFPAKTKVTVFGFIDSYEIVPMSGALSKIKAKLYKNGYSIILQWTVTKQKAKGMVYGLEQKSKGGVQVQVSGKLAEFKFQNSGVFRYIDQPTLTSLGNDTGTGSVSVIAPEPMYRLKDGIKINQVQMGFRELIANFDKIDSDLFMPETLEKRLGFESLLKSMKYAHGMTPIPVAKFNDFLNYDGFRKRIMAEKIWTIMKNGHSSKQSSDISEFELNDADIDKIRDVLSRLSFELTGDQKKAVWSLLKRFSSRNKSKNLVFGDVGSGKTMVSMIVSAVMYEKGFQVAVMAPTSILARQHYEEAAHLFPDWNVFVVHSRTTKKQKDAINKVLMSGEPAIVYGTSSINKMEFTNLSVIFVDEEQKFGVKDKDVLYEKSKAHLILMTATPIPRTLAGAMFSDFAVHKIEQKPAMQKDRITKIANLNEMPVQEINDIKARIKNGEQVLVIVPAIVSNEMTSVSSATEKFKKVFKEFKLDSINGRMKPENIEKTTEEFMAGNIDILVATTMVDAGFSNKTLSFVFIENADRFGIAQLHQIRGRVGRGSLQGHCYLSVMGNIKESTLERLQALVKSENGFELSMKDIELRGSGDLTGLEQSGSDVNLIEWLKEIEVMDEYLKGNLL
jgi:RecG-like helicase